MEKMLVIALAALLFVSGCVADERPVVPLAEDESLPAEPAQPVIDAPVEANESMAGDIPGAVRWDYDQANNAWMSFGTPPECPPLVFESPINMATATSILYPGQYRGPTKDDYKPHGGFRFDRQSSNDIEVRTPFDGYVWRGSRSLANGEIQYSFDVVNECGIMHRMGHLLALSPQFQELANRLPAPREGDTRTTDLDPFIFVKKGTLIATKVGLAGNVFFDWGVYDFRKENEASQSAAYREEHGDTRSFAFHALCWLEYFPADQQAVARSLPGGDSMSGAKSDYC